MKSRRVWTLLLALMLMVSVLAVTASAEEEMDYSPYLCFSWLDNWGDGWFESTDRDWYHDNRGMGMTPLDDRWMKFYAAEWNGSDWEYTPIDPAELVVENLTVTPFRDMPAEDVGDVIPGHDPKYFCRVNANDWGDASIRYTLDDDTVLTMGVSVQRNEDGFYSSMILNNDTYINNFRVNPLEEENSFYFGFQSTYWTLKEVELRDGADKFVTLEPTNKNNVYKITVKPEVAENIWNIGGFDMRLDVTVYNDDDPENSQEEVWCPGIWCNPVWYHEADWDASMFINGEEYLIAGDVVLRNYFVGTDSDDEGNTWDVWKCEKTELPKGVSYDVSTNTLTLDNAHLTNLEMGWHWVDEWSGDEGWNLPSQDLTIELIGESTIINDTDRAMCLREEVKATITGDGSLYVKATNSVRQNEWGDYVSYPAFTVEGGANLTIEGNANVTVEIAGEAWNGNDEWHEQMYLVALQMGGCDLTLCDSAVLTTVLPEGALRSGSEPHPHDPYWYPGGYVGIDNVNDLTVNDNATLNTTSLDIVDRTGWDEEKQEEYFIEAGSYIQNGGTVNITAQAEKGMYENWYWDEENQEEVYVTGTQYNYRGLNIWGEQSVAEINGGVLNIKAEPAEKENENDNIYSELLRTSCADLTVNGGVINLTAPHGCGISVGGWDEREDGTLTMTGGEINMTDGYMWMEFCPSGAANLNGGTIHIEDGDFSLNARWEWDEENQIDVCLAYSTVTIDGANVIIDNGHLNMDGDLIINSGMLSVTQQGDPNRGPDDYVWLARANGNLTVNGGELNLIGNDVNAVFETYGDVHQTGGDIRCIINESDDWRKYCSENWGYTPRTYAFQSYANVTVDGGFFVGYGHYGITIYQNENDDNKFVVNGGEVLGNGEMNGIFLFQDAEINDGMVRAISRGRMHTTYNEETGEPVEFYAGNAIVLSNGANLTINGGDHRLDGHINEGYPKASTGISLWDSARAAINGGSIRIAADMAMVSNGWSEPVNPFTLAEDMVIYSMVDGGHPAFVEDSYYDYLYDEDGNPIYDEDGNLVYDESVTYYDYWLEEDGVYEGGEEEIPDWSTDVVITSTKCGDSATWAYDVQTDTLTVTGTGAIYDYTDKLATGIAPWMWLHDNNLIKTIVLDEGITAIGTCAFWHRDEVEAPVSVTVGKNITKIGEKAFAADAVLTVYCGTAGDAYAKQNSLSATVLHAEEMLPAKEPTCTETGLTEGVKCSACGEVLVEQEVLPALGHDWDGTECTRCDASRVNPFTDVNEKSFCFTPVLWAVENGITTGVSEGTFAPDDDCTRGQVVTFLWRAAGSPEPKRTEHPFTDVVASAYYYKAMLWAVENGITNGLTADTFGPDSTCSRGQVVTFLWRAMGKPEVKSTQHPFTDVNEGAFYYKAMLWAVENGITNGVAANSFAPDDNCNRGQVVTFLYRTYVKP